MFLYNIYRFFTYTTMSLIFFSILIAFSLHMYNLEGHIRK